MARQLHTAVARGGPTSATGVTLTQLACNASDKERVASARRLLILFKNSGVTGRACVVDNGAPGGVACTFTLASGALKEVYVSSRWRQRSGTDLNYITFEAAHAEVIVSIVDES